MVQTRNPTTGQLINDGAALITTKDVESPKFVASDYPACVFMLNSDSVVRDGGGLLVDLAGGLTLTNGADETVERTSDDLGFTTVKVGGASTPNFAASATMPALGTKYGMYICIALDKAGASDPYFELGDTTTGTGAYVHIRAEGGYMSSTGSHTVESTAHSAPTESVVNGAILTFNRDEASDQLALRSYREDASRGVSEAYSGASDTGSINAQTFGAYTQSINLNISNIFYICAAFHLDDPRAFSDNFMQNALRWMVDNPGDLYPGFKDFAAAT